MQEKRIFTLLVLPSVGNVHSCCNFFNFWWTDKQCTRARLYVILGGRGQREGYWGHILLKTPKIALISEYLAADLSAVASADALAIINNSNSCQQKSIHVTGNQFLNQVINFSVWRWSWKIKCVWKLFIRCLECIQVVLKMFEILGPKWFSKTYVWQLPYYQTKPLTVIK